MNHQTATVRADADLPAGTRVMTPEGRLGTVNGYDVGRVTAPGHPNYGREYVGVDWDPAENDMGLNRRSRPFVSELTVITPPEHPRVGERVTYKVGRRTVNATVTRRANEAGQTGVVDDGDQTGSVRYIRPALLTVHTPDIDTLHGAALEENELRTLLGLSGAQHCTSHGIKDTRGGRAPELGGTPPCEPGTTYGAWSEGAGGFVYTGDCATEVANWAADELRQLAKEDDTDTIQILAICPDHEERPKNGCEECFTGE